ncbi:MAG: PD-(D/E)XK nuclease family transposase [Bacteroidales bacterium]|nr:PD-(D/E)XK nuclease family transposase [Bacteroidales bacterium]
MEQILNNNEIFMNPYTDFGFKKLFGTEPNKDILISFLNALFEGDRPPIVDLQYLNTEQLGPYYGERSSVFDVYCKTEDENYFIVEMQRSDQPYFKDRTVYYASAAIAQQGPRGPWNYELKDVCVIGILDFVFPNNEYGKDSYIHKVMLKDMEDHHLVYDKLTFYYVEMPKFTKKEDELETMQDKWLYVVKNICYLLRQPKELQEKVFTKFFEEARIGMFTGEERFAYMVSQKHYWDNINTLNYSFEKGVKRGKEEALKEVAHKLLSRGMSKESVRQMTGLNEI